MHAGCIGMRQFPCARGVTSWPQVPFGSYRIWDTGNTWSKVEPARGAWNFGALDERVAVAAQHGVSIDYVLGMTPAWAASNPASSSPYGAGANSMPARLADWTRYVSEVATRYKGRISAYEIWNEPNLSQYWTGTPAQMATLATAAYAAIKAADPAAVVVSPSLSARTGGSSTWLQQFLAAGGKRTFDVEGLHVYPYPGQTPEQAFALVDQQRQVLQQAGLSKVPIWDTEIGYGRTAPPPQNIISGTQAASFVARTYLMGLVANVERNYWYSYDDRGFVGLYLISSDGTPTQAARAYAMTYSWLVGANNLGCSLSTGVYQCRLGYPHATGAVVWRATGSTTIKAPQGAECVRTLDGAVQALRSGSSVTVGQSPQLIMTSNTASPEPAAVPGTLTAANPC